MRNFGIDMDELYYNIVDLLKRMISVPSVSREESAVADLVSEFMESYGCHVNRSGNNIWCYSDNFSFDKPTILLNSHIDTVKPVAGWTFPPFEATEVGDRIYGLGSNDAGASLVCLLSVFLALRSSTQSYNLVFLASCEEEVSGKDGVECVLPQLPPIAMAIVGEPTGMNPAVAEKGLMVLDGEIRGVSGHAARNEGINAIYKAVEVVQTLKDLKFEKESEYLGPVKISVTQILAGTQHNVVPDLCKIVVDVRTTDAYSNEETLEIIRKSVKDCDLVPRSTRLRPSSISMNNPVVQRLVFSGKEPFGSPTLSDQALMPFPSLKVGPGDSSRSHTADEYICQSEIREAMQIYYTVLNGLRL